MATRIAERPVDDPMADETDITDDDLSALVDVVATARKSELDDLLAVSEDAATDDNPYQLLADLGRVMEQAVAVRCSADTISKALDTLHDELMPRAAALHAHSNTPTFNQEITAIWEAQHLSMLAEAVLTASDARHESRGSLRRLDFPQRDDEHFLTHSMIDTVDGGETIMSTHAEYEISWQPVHIDDFPPKARAY